MTQGGYPPQLDFFGNFFSGFEKITLCVILSQGI
jgi:hypothetical protein